MDTILILLNCETTMDDIEVFKWSIFLKIEENTEKYRELRRKQFFFSSGDSNDF